MDQNSEVLNRAINESLKQVARGRRRRGVMILGLGIVVSLIAYTLPLMDTLAQHAPALFFRLIAYPGIACILYGSVLLALGSKARLLYLKYFGNGKTGRAIFYGILITITVVLDLIFRIYLASIITQ